ncbi:MAG TPA: hypothetical protein VF101_00710 [Gaiellaceae bacterium]
MDRQGRLMFFRVVGEVDVVHLRIGARRTLCGIDTADCYEYTTGPLDAADAPHVTCDSCLASPLALREPLVSFGFVRRPAAH